MKKLILFLFIVLSVNICLGFDSSDKLVLYLPFNDTIEDYSGESVTTTLNAGDCYQETANVSTACGGLSTGTYGGGSANWYDGNWNTFANASTTMYINYTIPNNIYGATWRTKAGHDDGLFGIAYYYDNISIPSTCLDNGDNKLRLKVLGYCFGENYNYSCYNGSTWTYLESGGACGFLGGGYFYEEAIRWDKGAETYTTDRNSKNNAALMFNGISNFINATYTHPDTTPFYLSTWIKHLPSTGVQKIVAGNLGQRISIYQNGSVTTNFGCGASGNMGYINDSEWTHIVAGNNGSKSCLYFNSILQGCVNCAINNTDSSYIHIGRERSSSSQFYNGTLDEVRIYNRSLDPYEIINLYNMYNGSYVVTSNISSYSNTIRNTFSVGITQLGMTSPTCGVELNSTGISCTNSTTSICTVPSSIVKEVINAKPFCSNGAKIYSEEYNLSIDNTRLKLNVKSNITGSWLSSYSVTGSGISQKTIGNDTYIWGSGTKTLTITKSGYAIGYLNITFTSIQQNETVYLSPNNTMLVRFFDTNGNELQNVTTMWLRTGWSMTNYTTSKNISAYLLPATYTVTVNKTGYEDSQYIETINNNYIILDAYLNPDDETLARVIYVKDYSSQIISGATVTIRRYVDVNLETVYQGTTDYNGYITAYLEPTTSYVVTVSHPDYGSKTIGWQPIDASIVINIGRQPRPDYSTYLDNISYSTGTPFIYLLQNTSYTFNLTVASSSNSLEYYGVWVNNSGDITNNNETGDPSGSTVQVTILTDYNDTVYFPITIRHYFKQDCCSVVVKEQKLFAVPNSATNHTLTYAFGELRNSLDISDDNLGLVAGILVTFITIALIGMLRIFVGITDSTLLTLIGLIIQGVWCALGFFNWFIWSTIFIPYILYKMMRLTRGT